MGANDKHGRGHVLIIDDDPEVRGALERACRERGLAVRGADSGLEALEELQRDGELPDAILLDLTQPGTSGHSFLERLQRDPRLKDIPIVLASDVCETCDWRPDDLGVVAVETKPYDVPRVSRTLERVGRRHRARAESQLGY